MRAAQAGDEAAFVRLWRDANPVMTRYLRVAGVDDPYDAACEAWITVVRGLPGFQGDETAWRVWLLACARVRAEEGTLRRSWGSVTVLRGTRAKPGEDPLELDDLHDTDEVVHRGVNDAIAAIRALPLGQGEVVMLRLCAQLPVPAVADVAGTDAAAVRRSEERALDRLAVDRELLSWSLLAPATPAELADERVVAGAFRSLPRAGGSSGGAKVIALGPRQGKGRSGRTRTTAGWSRSALVGLAAVSASVVSLGGVGAAAYTGSLPSPVQRVMHDALGAPPPRDDLGSAGGAAGRTGSADEAGPPSVPTSAAGPDAARASAAGLCRAWVQDRAQGVARERSVAFRKLAAAAGGAGHVTAYCVVAVENRPTTPAQRSTASGGSGHPSPTRTTTPAHTAPSPKGGSHSPSTGTAPSPSSNPRTTPSGSPTNERPGQGHQRSTTSATSGDGAAVDSGAAGGTVPGTGAATDAATGKAPGRSADGTTADGGTSGSADARTKGTSRRR
jgi:DNA-directed RNA polymerase specialized sigma24 family protein